MLLSKEMESLYLFILVIGINVHDLTVWHADLVSNLSQYLKYIFTYLYPMN